MDRSKNNNVNWDYDAAKVLGKGTLGCVFVGMFNDMTTAVKRIDRAEFTAQQQKGVVEESNGIIRLDHPNVLKVLFVDHDCYFRYIIMELCKSTIGDYCRGKYTGAVPPDPEALHQMTSGLAYIHSKGFLHRDIKADNILITWTAVNNDHQHILLKISEFGVSQPARRCYTYNGCQTLKGMRHFDSSELLKMADEVDSVSGPVLLKKASPASDVFSLGCLFYCFLTKGKHPFSCNSRQSSFYIAVNILEGKYNLNLLRKDQSWAHQIVAAMIQTDPKNRWDLEKVANVLRPLLINSMFS